MPQFDCVVSVPVVQSPRVLQTLGLFDVPPSPSSERRWSVNLPVEGFDWNVGLIVGPSGSGKSTVARQAFSDSLVSGFDWPDDRSILDAFPPGMGIKDITGSLSSVGFSSPPSWLRPYRALSNGEQFRATLARAMAELPSLFVIDEFTSVVDRTVAQVGSAAVAKAVRRAKSRFVAVSCHHDIVEWLDPDWVLEMPGGEFTRRCLQGRPKVSLAVRRVGTDAWAYFKHHHYMSASLHRAAKCFAAVWRDVPVAFASVLHTPGKVSYWREHRTVCLPDFQGVGIGNALSEFVAGLMRATGKRYMSTTSSPAMIRHRHRSPFWRMHRKPSRSPKDGGRFAARLAASRATCRLAAGFEYVGPALPDDARRLGVI